MPGELHYTHHMGWLRAAVLGANDGLISTSSLVVGVVAAPARDELGTHEVTRARPLHAALFFAVA